MKKIVTLSCTLLVGILSACGTGQTTTGEEETISTGAPQNIHTSSDMNISPSNMTTSEPAIKPSDTSTAMKPAVKQD